MQTFVLRKIGGTFDACRLAGGRPSVRPLGAAPSLLATVGGFASALVLPLIAFVIASALVWLAMHVGHGVHSHGVHSHIASLSLGGMAIGQTEELKKLNDEFHNITVEFRKRNDQMEAEAKKFGEASAETKSMVEKLNARLDEFEVKIQRARFAGVGETKSDEEAKALDVAKSAFRKIAAGRDSALNEEERKSLATDSSPDGGWAIPQVLSNRIIEKLILLSPFRSLASVESLAQGDTLEIPAEGAQDFAYGWVSQRQSRPQTAAGQLRMEKIPVHEIYAEPSLSQNTLDDTAFDLEAWASKRVARWFAKAEGAAFIAGSGVGQPEGVLTNTDVTHVVSGDANLIKMDGMFDLKADLPTEYAQNAKIICNRKTTYALRKLKDSQNRYLWEPSPIAGNPPAFDGTPVIEMPDMPDIAANAFPVAIGDWQAAYTIVDRIGMRLIRDNVTAKPFVLLYTTKRVGGQVVLAEAMRTLKISA